jgi:hypothetical protein
MTIASCILIVGPLVADMQQAQLLMVAGFVMLGWVLARRQIKMRKRVNRDAKAANKAIRDIRHHKEPAVPLSDAPPETQRWQAAMFDLQRELKADLDTRIVVVQTLLRQMDRRIGQLAALESAADVATATLPTITPEQHQTVEQLLRSGHTAKEIATKTGLPQGDIEFVVSTIQLH